MRRLRILLLFSIATSVLAVTAIAQDEAPSLGDVARKARSEKQAKEKDAEAGKDAAPPKAVSPEAQNKTVQPKEATTKVVAQSTPSKDAPATKNFKKTITNDEIPEHVGPTSTRPRGTNTPTPEYPQPDYGNGKIPADYWQQRIMAQKDAIASVKSNIETVSASIQYAGANCVSNCVQWNERQEQKQQQVESMKVQLEQMQQQLEEMQEMARKQGYGSSVYDP